MFQVKNGWYKIKKIFRMAPPLATHWIIENAVLEKKTFSATSKVRDFLDIYWKVSTFSSTTCDHLKCLGDEIFTMNMLRRDEHESMCPVVRISKKLCDSIFMHEEIRQNENISDDEWPQVWCQSGYCCQCSQRETMRTPAMVWIFKCCCCFGSTTHSFWRHSTKWVLGDPDWLYLFSSQLFPHNLS